MAQRIETGQLICTWLSRLLLQNSSNNKYCSTKFTLDVQQLLLNAHGKLSHIASKTGNVHLSQLHLYKYLKLMNYLNSVNKDVNVKNIGSFDAQYISGLDKSQIWSKSFWPVSNSVNGILVLPEFSNGVTTDDFLSKKSFFNNLLSAKHFATLNDAVLNLKMFLRTEKMVVLSFTM